MSSTRVDRPKPSHPLRVEIATTPEQIAKGLSGRRRIGENQGMLFVLQQRQPFWMPDMHFPLDMIWLDASWRVVAIARNVPPCVTEDNCPGYLPDIDFSYVLEVKAGYAKRYGVRVGGRFLSFE